jgi:DNA-binding MarR family transcriptional regulator
MGRMTTRVVIERMVRQGLLMRRRSRADARAYVLKMTDQGRWMLAAGEHAARRVDAIALGALPKDTRQRFPAALMAISQTRRP